MQSPRLSWPGRRTLLVGTVALAHLALLAWLSNASRAPPPPPTLTVVGLSDGRGFGLPAGLRRSSLKPSLAELKPHLDKTPPPAAQTKPKRPADEAVRSVQASAPPPPPDLTAEPQELDAAAERALNARIAAAGAAGPARADPECGLSARIAADLQADPEAAAAIDGLPPAALSVSGAVLIWDGGWLGPDRLDGLDLGRSIRDRITESVRRTPPDCLERPVLGPRFLVINGATGARVLAIGSGRWRWSSLAASGNQR